MNQLSPTDLQRVFERFLSLYGKFGAPGLKDNVTLFTQEWYSQLRYFSVKEVNQAVEKWIGGTKAEWPKPGQLKAIIYEARGDTNQAKVSQDKSFWDEDTCPCGCKWIWATVGKDKDGQPIVRRVQTCRAKREGLAPAY